MADTHEPNQKTEAYLYLANQGVVHVIDEISVKLNSGEILVQTNSPTLVGSSANDGKVTSVNFRVESSTEDIDYSDTVMIPVIRGLTSELSDFQVRELIKADLLGKGIAEYEINSSVWNGTVETKGKASKIAGDAMIKRLKNNIMPPETDPEDLA
jgi:hypothetical protein